MAAGRSPGTCCHNDSGPAPRWGRGRCSEPGMGTLAPGQPGHGVTEGPLTLSPWLGPAGPSTGTRAVLVPVPGLSPPGVGTAAWGCAVLQGQARLPRARLCHALACRAELCHALPRRAGLCRALLCRAGLCHALPRRAVLCHALPRGARRAGGWSMARCHSGKYFAGAAAAGPRPPAAVGAPGDPGAGASSQLPLPRSSSEAASSAPTPPTPPRLPAGRPARGWVPPLRLPVTPLSPCMGTPRLCPSHPAGLGEVPLVPGSLLAGLWQSPARAALGTGAERCRGWRPCPGGAEPPLPPGETLGLVEFSTRKTAESRGKAGAAGNSPGQGTVPCLRHTLTSQGLRPGRCGGPLEHRQWDVLGVPCPRRCSLAISPGGSRPCPSGVPVPCGTEQPGGFSRYPSKGESGRASDHPACGSAGKLRHKRWGLTWRHPFPSLSRPNWPPQSGDIPPRQGRG